MIKETDYMIDIDGSKELVREKNTEETPCSNRIPPWRRYTLTIEEAAEYYHIGQAKLRSIAADVQMSDFIIYNGNRVLIKRIKFENYLDNCTVV